LIERLRKVRQNIESASGLADIGTGAFWLISAFLQVLRQQFMLAPQPANKALHAAPFLASSEEMRTGQTGLLTV
jgi:hypothetical protein